MHNFILCDIIEATKLPTQQFGTHLSHKKRMNHIIGLLFSKTLLNYNKNWHDQVRFYYNKSLIHLEECITNSLKDFDQQLSKHRSYFVVGNIAGVRNCNYKVGPVSSPFACYPTTSSSRILVMKTPSVINRPLGLLVKLQRKQIISIYSLTFG